MFVSKWNQGMKLLFLKYNFLLGLVVVNLQCTNNYIYVKV
jgi:hypothetical protein